MEHAQTALLGAPVTKSPHVRDAAGAAGQSVEAGVMCAGFPVKNGVRKDRQGEKIGIPVSRYSVSALSPGGRVRTVDSLSSG